MKNIYLIAILVASSAICTDMAMLKNIVALDGCEGKISLESLPDGGTLVTFDHLITRREDQKPFAKCRLRGELDLPKDHKIGANNIVKALVVGNFTKPGDKLGGRLYVSINQERNGELKMDPGCHEDEPHEVELKAHMPEITITDASTLHVNILLEAMINYRLDVESKVNAKLASLVLPTIKLEKITKTPGA